MVCFLVSDSKSVIRDKMNLSHLSPIARQVTQNHGTEPPFSSPLNSNKKPGLYTCVVCNAPVFRFNKKQRLNNSFFYKIILSLILVQFINLIVKQAGLVFILLMIQLQLLQNKIMF